MGCMYSQRKPRLSVKFEETLKSSWKNRAERQKRWPQVPVAEPRPLDCS